MKKIELIKAVPILPFAYVDSLKTREKSQQYAHCRKWSHTVLRFLGLSLDIQGVEQLKEAETYYFVCNHQGTLDPALIVDACPYPIRFVSKLENASIPLLGRWAKNIGCIHFDRESRQGNIHMLRETMRALKKQENILIFPEGTRSKSDMMNPFMEKALQPAYQTKATIVPISLSNSYVLDVAKDSSKQCKIVFGKPIPYERYKDVDKDAFCDSLQKWIASQIEKSK